MDRSIREDIKNFHWVTLKKEILWEYMENLLNILVTIFRKIIFAKMIFLMRSLVKRCVTYEKIKCWLSANVETDKKWTELFLHFQQNIFYQNILKIVEYALSLSATNAATERVFSSINKIWTTEKTQFNIKTLKSILSVKYNLTNSCEKFHDILKNDPFLLQSIHSDQKYDGERKS